MSHGMKQFSKHFIVPRDFGKINILTTTLKSKSVYPCNYLLVENGNWNLIRYQCSTSIEYAPILLIHQSLPIDNLIGFNFMNYDSLMLSNHLEFKTEYYTSIIFDVKPGSWEIMRYNNPEHISESNKAFIFSYKSFIKPIFPL